MVTSNGQAKTWTVRLQITSQIQMYLLPKNNAQKTFCLISFIYAAVRTDLKFSRNSESVADKLRSAYAKVMKRGWIWNISHIFWVLVGDWG
jgi:hypothetical protein